MEAEVADKLGLEAAELLCAYSANRVKLLFKDAGKLAVEGTGDGVYDRRSAYDLAARRFVRPPGESANPNKPEDWRPSVP